MDVEELLREFAEATNGAAAGCGLLVALLAFHFRSLPGHRYILWFSLMALSAALYSTCALAFLPPGVPPWLVVMAFRLSVVGGAVHLIAWILFAVALDGGRVTRAERWAIGAALLPAALSLLPGVMVGDELRRHTVGVIRLAYTIPSVGPLGPLYYLLPLSLLLPVWRFFRSARRKDRAAWPLFLGAASFWVGGLLEVSSTLGWTALPFFAQTGPVLVLVIVARVIATRVEAAAAEDHQALRSLTAELERRVRERTTVLAERTDALKRANAELARAGKAKDEFLANMSHELRTPLNAVLGLSEALLEEVYGSLTEKQRSSLSVIEQSGQHLLAIINDILDLSRIEAGRIELSVEPVDLPRLADQALAFVRDTAQAKQVELSARSAPGLAGFHGDATRLRQVLVNLLANGVRFTDEGGAVELEIRPGADPGTVEVHVADTGIGIAPEDLDRLFQPFVQLDASLTRRHGGAGLGLALSRRLVELHGGRIEVESVLGSGSRFRVVLPTIPDRGAAAGESEARR